MKVRFNAASETLSERWKTIDFVVHALGFSDKNELKGPYLNTSRDNFSNTMMVSAFSFTETAQCARKMMLDGALLTLSYIGAQRIAPNYNVMGVAKAALESSVRYLAVDLGGREYPGQWAVGRANENPCRRGNHRSAAYLSTLEDAAPLGRNPDIHEVGKSGLYLISDLSSGVTGETHFVDGGFNTVGVPREL